MSKHKQERPDPKDLKPINVYESELLPVDTIEVMSSAEPRYIVVYHHLSKEEAIKTIERIQEGLNMRGSVILSFIGRIV